MAKINPGDMMPWVQLIAQLIQVGAVTIPQVVAAFKAIGGQEDDLHCALEDAQISAETHAILQQIIQQAQAGG
jgi:hypothetical protein